MTDNSDVQPIGKLKKYRKTIWMRNARNMMPSRPATIFSARRRIQATARLMVGFMRAPPFPRGHPALGHRHRPQQPAVRLCPTPRHLAVRGTLWLLDSGDLVEGSRRPGLRLVGCEVDLLRVRAERGDVRRVDIEALLLEAVGELRLLLQVLIRAPRNRLVGRGLESLLLGGPMPCQALWLMLSTSKATRCDVSTICDITS